MFGCDDAPGEKIAAGRDRHTSVRRVHRSAPGLGSWPSLAAILTGALLVLLLSSGCGHDDAAAVEGRVTGLDVFGDVVGYGGARVIVRDTGGVTRVGMVRTDEDGRFRVPLTPGDYVVELWAGLFPKEPSVTMPVEVREGRVTTVPTFQSDYCRKSEVPLSAFRRIRRILRAEIERLALVPDSASFTIYGSHAASTEVLFGPTDLPADEHVYVVVLQGDPTVASPHGEETRALRGNGYVALLVGTATFSTRSIRVSETPWDEVAAAEMFPAGGSICYLP